MLSLFKSPCPHCGYLISENPALCPKCRRWLRGNPAWKSQEKRWLQLGLLSLPVIGFLLFLLQRH